MKIYIQQLGTLTLIALLGFSAISGAQEDTWTGRADMPAPRSSLSNGAVNGKIYVIGGATNAPFKSLLTVEEYDPFRDTWRRRANMPTARCCLSTSVVNGKIYAIGGFVEPHGPILSTVEEYDPVTDTWTRKADMPTARLALSAGMVNGRIYAIGGGKEGFVGLSSVEEYDPATDTWTKKADMPTPRGYLSASVVNGKIYAIGGRQTPNLPSLSIVEVYDPATDTWTEKAKIPTPRAIFSTSVVNGKIYAIGGGFGPTVTSAVEVYDPATNVWTKKADMSIARGWLTTSAVNGLIYAIGGTRSGLTALSTVEAYDTGMGIPVTAISPQAGKVTGGEPIAMAGSGFPLNALVTIGGNPLIDLKVTDGLIQGLIPPGTPGEQELLMISPSHPMSDFFYRTTFRYTQPTRPVALSMTPTSGLQSGGQPAVIEGAGFQLGATITIGLAKATDVVVTPTKITFTIPESNRPGTLVVVVENPGGGTSSRLQFTYISLPEIGELQPNKGPVEGGTQVTLFGKGFLPDAKVTIGDVPAEQVEFLAFTRLRFITPPNMEGATAVRVINNDGQETIKEGAFTYEAPELAVEEQQKLLTKWGKVKHTMLLQNYPNPFNPETWIPYALAEHAFVTVRVYNITGELIRTLEVGKQPKGIYVSPERAVYWDGKDNTGQLVASGVYYYQLQVSSGARSRSIGMGDFKQTRRMLLLK